MDNFPNNFYVVQLHHATNNKCRLLETYNLFDEYHFTCVLKMPSEECIVDRMKPCMTDVFKLLFKMERVFYVQSNRPLYIRLLDKRVLHLKTTREERTMSIFGQIEKIGQPVFSLEFLFNIDV